METRQVRNEYTFPWEGKLYQIEGRAVVSGLRGAKVRVEKRLNGTLAVRYGERYLPIQECVVAEKRETAAAGKPAGRQRRVGQRSDWNKNFDLTKGPKVWQAAQASGGKPSLD
jgi:hypothetical protein